MTKPKANDLAARRARTAWLLLLPTTVVVLLVAGWPLLATLRYSFFDVSSLDLSRQRFVGFDNYVRLFQDPNWLTSVKNTVIFTVSSVSLELLLGLAIALILNSAFRARGIVRAAILIPWAIPTVVSSQMWRWMYNDVFGVINDVLLRTGLIAAPISLIGSPETALASIIAVDVWKTTPFMALLLLAGLQTIPGSLYEAAKVDGASTMQQFWRITLPLLVPAILVALIFRTLDALKVFDVIYVMKGSDLSTITMAVYNNQQLREFFSLGFGSAVSVTIFLIIGVFTVIYITSLRVKFD